MGGPIYCVDCNAMIVEETTERGIRLVGGEEVEFRRRTDFVICPECLAVYNVQSLLQGASPEDSRVEDPDGAMIDRLAELAEEGGAPPE